MNQFLFVKETKALPTQFSASLILYCNYKSFSFASFDSVFLLSLSRILFSTCNSSLLSSTIRSKSASAYAVNNGETFPLLTVEAPTRLSETKI